MRYTVRLLNVFWKLIVTFRRVPWIILFYAFLVVIHTHYKKSKHWLLKTKTTKHNSNPQIVRQYELLSSSV